MNIYGFNSKLQNLQLLKSLQVKRKPVKRKARGISKGKGDSKIPIENFWGGIRNVIDPPIDFDALRNYRYKSETHSASLNFKLRNIAMKGFDFLNTKDDLSGVKKLLVKANNNGQTLHDVIVDFTTDFLELGNGMFEVVGFNGDHALYSVDPYLSRAVTDPNGVKVLEYEFLSSGTFDFRIEARKPNKKYYRYIKHLRLPNSLSDVWGMPDYYSCLDSIDINYAIDTWIKNFMDNNARFDFLIITAGDELDDTSEQKLKTALESNKGVENKGKGGYLAVGYDTDVKVIELNKVDHSAFLEGKGEYIQQIIQAHGLSGHSVGFSKAGNSIAGNEAIGALRKDYETYIKPMQELLQNKLNQMFEEMYGVNPLLTFRPMDVVSEKEKAVIRDTDYKNKIVSASYLRRKYYPDMTDDEIKDIENNIEPGATNFQEKPDSFDDTQNYERADRR